MSTSERSRAARSRSKPTKKSTAKPKTAKPKPQPHVCQEPGCARSFPTARGLTSHQRQAHPPAPVIESPAAAVESVLATLRLKPRQAVLVATIRELAKTLEVCESTDKTKTAKELTALMHELLDNQTDVDEPDWTEDEG